ncbi:MAG: 2-hydroxyacid dehydrogenase, partial [Cyanobacteria bacterium P01_A01_bin.17]
NVVITAHQAFFTKEALRNIAETTLSNISDVEAGRQCSNAVKPTR